MTGPRRAGALLLCIGLLAGCSLFQRPTSRPETPDEQYCRGQVDDDPSVKALMQKELGSQTFQFNNQDQIRTTRQDAMTACLRRRGAIPQGGVERQKAR